MSKTYQEIKATAPKNHNSKEFKVWLLNHNNVIAVGKHWIGLENIRLHRPEKPCYVFFPIDNNITDDHILEMWSIRQEYSEMAFYVNKIDDKSVHIEHFHLVDYSISQFIDDYIKSL